MLSVNKRIIFAGGRDLGVRVFAWLNTCDWADIIGVVPLNQKFDPDFYDEMCRLIKKYNVPVISIEDLSNLSYDIGLSVNFNKIIKPEVLEKPTKGFFNVHHSYNLRLRGRNIATQAILNSRVSGYYYHGTTLHKMVSELDAGPIVASRACDIKKNDTAYTLFKRVDKLAYELIKEWMPRIALQNIATYETPTKDVYLFKNKDLPDKEVKLDMDDDAFYDFVRAFDFPGKEPAYYLDNKQIVPLVIIPRENEYESKIILKKHVYYTK